MNAIDIHGWATYNLANFLNSFIENAKSGWERNHETSQTIFVLLRFLLEVKHVYGTF